MTLGNHIGAAVPGEPLQVSAAIWQTGGEDDEVHPVKVTWKVDYYGCRLSQEDNESFDFGQTVQAPTLNSDRVFPVVNATFTVPTTQCRYPVPAYTIHICTQVADDPTDTGAAARTTCSTSFLLCRTVLHVLRCAGTLAVRRARRSCAPTR
ncbi:hypothetical protein ACFQ2H_07170 [Streptomyces violaceoruber]